MALDDIGHKDHKSFAQFAASPQAEQQMTEIAQMAEASGAFHSSKTLPFLYSAF